MLSRIILSIVVAVAVALVCILLGGILISLKVDVAQAIGDFLQAYGGAIGVLAGLWYFFSGHTFDGRPR